MVNTISINLFGFQEEPFSNGVSYTAESLEFKTLEVGPVRYYVGRVRLVQDDITITCDSAIQYFSLNKSILRGRVKLVQNKMTIIAPYMEYFHDTKFAKAEYGIKLNDGKSILIADTGYYQSVSKVAEFYGNIDVDDDSLQLLSNYLQYNRITKNIYAYGEVNVSGKFNQTTLIADSIEHFPKRGVTDAFGNPLMIRTTCKDKAVSGLEDCDTIFVKSGKITSKRTNIGENFVFYKSVKLHTKEAVAQADSSVYAKDSSTITLYGTPTVWYGDTQLHGDTIFIAMEESELKKINSLQNAFSISTSDTLDSTRKNQLAGQFIEINFSEGYISRILAKENSQSLYHFLSDEGSEGLAKNSCDSIFINFEFGEIEIINWLGANSGEFVPNFMVDSESQDFKLKGFKWIADKPQKPVYILRNRIKRTFHE